MGSQNEALEGSKTFQALTDEQQKLLLQSIEIIKQDIVSDVVKSLRAYLLIGVSLLTVFGAVSVVGMKSAIQDAAVASLSSDPELKESMLEKIDERAKQQSKQGNLLIQNSLRDLQKLIEQTRENAEAQ